MSMKNRREIAVMKDEVIIIGHFLQFALQLKFPMFVNVLTSEESIHVILVYLLNRGVTQ